MKRLFVLPALLGLVAIAGCGSSSSPTAEANPSGSTNSSDPGAVVAPSSMSNPTAAAPASVGSPADVVSQFLDEIRRGGEDSRANDLLTTTAKSELKRIGQSVQPIGSPDAAFKVTRFESLPDDPNSALVHSLWSEPNGDGTSSQFQVVWAVHLEPVGWRISGLAMELDPNQPPMVIDFENGDLMAKLLSPPAEPQNTPSQATAEGATIAR